MKFIDLQILIFINDYLSCAFMDFIMKFFTALGDFGMVWILTGLLFILAGSKFGREFFGNKFGLNTKNYLAYGVLLLAVLLISFLIAEPLLKNIIQRPRPFIEYPFDLIINPQEGYSMPSGHSVTSFASAFIVLKANRRFGIVAFITAVFIAFSRLYLTVHYPTDVIFGAVIGLLCAWLLYLLARQIFKTQFLGSASCAVDNVNGGDL